MDYDFNIENIIIDSNKLNTNNKSTKAQINNEIKTHLSNINVKIENSNSIGENTITYQLNSYIDYKHNKDNSVFRMLIWTRIINELEKKNYDIKLKKDDDRVFLIIKWHNKLEIDNDEIDNMNEKLKSLLIN